MNEREAKITETAMRVFSRYGYKRVTMNDIATEAGMARQTLYNAFASKEEVLRACIRCFVVQTVGNIKAGLKSCTSGAEVLDLILGEVSLKPYRILAQSNHADEIIDGYTRFAASEKAEGDRQYLEVIQKALAPYQQMPEESDIQLSVLADFILSSAYSAKQSARDEAHLLSRLNTLKVLVLKGL